MLLCSFVQELYTSEESKITGLSLSFAYECSAATVVIFELILHRIFNTEILDLQFQRFKNLYLVF